ncbi:MAG: hypothetical protein ACWA6U_15450, partial [Breznakibacter sp.]
GKRMQNKGFIFVIPNRFEKFFKSFPQTSYTQQPRKADLSCKPSTVLESEYNLRQNEYTKQANDNKKSKKTSTH